MCHFSKQSKPTPPFMILSLWVQAIIPKNEKAQISDSQTFYAGNIDFKLIFLVKNV